MSDSALDEMFSKAMGLDSGFDPESGMDVISAEGGPEIFLRADREARRLILFAEIARFDEEQLEKLKVPLLEANFCFAETDGCSIGLREGIAFLTRQERFLTVDAPGFLEVVARFAATILHWQEQILQPVTDWKSPDAFSTLPEAPAPEVLHKVVRLVVGPLMGDDELEPDEAGQYELICGENQAIVVRVDLSLGIELVADLGPDVAERPGFVDQALEANVHLASDTNVTVALNPANGHAALCGFVSPSSSDDETFRALLEVMLNELVHWADLPAAEADGDEAQDPLFLLKQFRI